MLNMCGNNWRARCEVHNILNNPEPRRFPFYNLNLNHVVLRVLDTVINDFILEDDIDWAEAVSDFIPYTVLRIEVVLASTLSSTNGEPGNKFGEFQNTAASWLLKGLLANPVPLVNSNVPKLADVPEIPMVIVYNWLKWPHLRFIRQDPSQIRSTVAVCAKDVRRSSTIFHRPSQASVGTLCQCDGILFRTRSALLTRARKQAVLLLEVGRSTLCRFIPKVSGDSCTKKRHLEISDNIS